MKTNNGKVAYGLEAEQEYIKTILMSSFVKGHRSLSGIIISIPDTGKSESLMQYFKLPGLTFLSDATAYGILSELLDGIKRKSITHIVIPDLLKILNRNYKVAKELVSTLNSLAEEGFTGTLTYNIKILMDKPIRCGFMTSITMGGYKTVKKMWKSIGFSSRIVPFFFGYNAEDLENAQESILNEEVVFTESQLQFPDEPRIVSFPDEYKAIIKKISNFVGKVNGDFTAMRTIRNMMTFAKAHALLRDINANTVIKEDIKFIKSMVPFWFDPIIGNDCDYHIIQNIPAKSTELVDKLQYSQGLIYERLKVLMLKGVLKEVNKTWETTY